ncbi:MAG TPA: hypothetical protein VGR70_12315 [Stellaceae bacterium]|nr:hypothetical protein [Stellaceae bacterium]
MSIAEFISAAPPRRATTRRPPATLPKFPAVEPGQLWLIEASVDGAPSAPARHAVDSANVVIYDRALAETLSGSLPLGTYAEPAADGPPDRSAARCVRFARDGWSVARLLAAPATQRDRIAAIRRLVEELAGGEPPTSVAVTVIGELPDGICEPTETRLDRLDLVVVTYPQDARLTIVVEGAGGGIAAARPQAVAGNGLAG